MVFPSDSIREHAELLLRQAEAVVTVASRERSRRRHNNSSSNHTGSGVSFLGAAAVGNVSVATSTTNSKAGSETDADACNQDDTSLFREGSSVTQTLADDLSTSSSSSEEEDTTEAEPQEHSFTEAVAASSHHPSVVSLTHTSFSSAASSVCSSSAASSSERNRDRDTYEMARLRQALEHCRKAVLMVEDSAQIKVQKLQMEIQALRKQVQQQAKIRSTDARQAAESALTPTTPVAVVVAAAAADDDDDVTAVRRKQASLDPTTASSLLSPLTVVSAMPSGKESHEPLHPVAPARSEHSNESPAATQQPHTLAVNRRPSHNNSNASLTRLQQRARQLWVEQLVQIVDEEEPR